MARNEHEVGSGKDYMDTTENPVSDSAISNLFRVNLERHRVFVEGRMDPNHGLVDRLQETDAIDYNQVQIMCAEKVAFLKNRKILDIISEGNASEKIAKLCQVLRETKQQHLLNYVVANGEYKTQFAGDWPLSEREITIIDKNVSFLKQKMETAYGMLANMRMHNTITQWQEERVSALPDRFERNTALLDIIRRGSLSEYRSTIDRLVDTKQEHIAEILMKGGAVVQIHSSVTGRVPIIQQGEAELVTQLMNVMQKKTTKEKALLLELAQLINLGLIDAVVTKSIGLFFHCKNLSDFLRLLKLLESKELQRTVEVIYNEFISTSTKIEVTLTWNGNEFSKVKRSLQDMESTYPESSVAPLAGSSQPVEFETRLLQPEEPESLAAPWMDREIQKLKESKERGGRRSLKSENSRIRNEVVNMYKMFVSEVDPKDVLDFLVLKRVISIERKDEVMSKVTRQDRCRALLDKLFSSSNDEAFLVLRQALDEHYYWIVERIDLSKSANKEFISSGNLEVTKNNEVELNRQLDEACRRITELEEEVVEYRTKTMRFESELHSLQDSYDETMKRERKSFKDQMTSLEDRLCLTEGEDDDDDTVNLAVKEETQTGEGSDILLAPPLPPRRSARNTELDHSTETADILKDTIVSRPQLVTIINGCTPVRGMALLDGWLYVVRFGSTQVEVYEAKDEFKRSKKSITITSPGQREKFGLFHRLKSRPKKEHVSSGIQDIASCNRNKRLYLSDWQNMCVHCVDPVRKEVTRSWGVESGKPWGISVTSEGNVIVSCGDSAKLCEYSAEGLLLRTIELTMTDEGPWHGLQLLGVDRWVVFHGGVYANDGYVCVVGSEGNYAKGYEEIQLNGPSHLAVLSSNHVLVAESTRNRIILLPPSLRGPVREILNRDQGIMMPVRIHLCESSGRLVVGLVDGNVLVYQIMKAADEPSASLSS